MQSIADASADASGMGYKSGTYSYAYDANGNMVTDNSKGLSITYNLLNLPNVNTLPNGSVTYTYDASGRKLRKVSTVGSGTTTDYIDGVQYTNNAIDFIQTEEGRALNNAGNYHYEYNLADHLGDNRLSYDTYSGATSTTQQDDYMPFGMEISAGTLVSPKNEYLYNKKELQEELGQYDYGARFYDPVIGRFTTIDPVAKHFPWLTSYQYASNNPISKIDLDGLEGFPIELFFEESAVVPKATPQSGAGYSVENIAKAGGDVAKGSSKMSPETLDNFKRGNLTESEQLSKNGLQKNNSPIKQVDPKTGKEDTTIPDAFKNDGKSTVEVKDVKQQSLTKQLRLQEKFSNDNGFKPELIINEGAKISKPLQNSTFDIKLYQASPVTLKVDATKTPGPKPQVPANLHPMPNGQL